MKHAPTDPWAQRLHALASVVWALVVLATCYLWSRVVRERIATGGSRRAR